MINNKNKKIMKSLGINAPKSVNMEQSNDKIILKSDQDSTATILIIDDEIKIVDFVKSFLEESHIKTLYALSVRDGKAILHSDLDISMILLDLNLPDEDGFLMLKYLKNNLRFKKIPVVIMSGYSHHTAVVRSLEGGASDYLRKPFNSEMLLTRVFRILNRGQGRILVVSENKTGIYPLIRSLQQKKYKVYTAQNGKDAQAIISDIIIDIVISEFDLGDMTGFDLLVYTQETHQGLPTIFIKDKSLNFSEKEIIAAGGFGVILRPFNNEDLIRKIESTIMRCGWRTTK